MLGVYGYVCCLALLPCYRLLVATIFFCKELTFCVDNDFYVLISYFDMACIARQFFLSKVIVGSRSSPTVIYA